MSSRHTLGELQLAIIRVLWTSGTASVAEVHANLPEVHRRALTTIATMLSKMEKKGVVRHRTVGRQFVYRATVSESDVKRSMVAELAHRLFEGDYTALVTHLIEEREIAADELDELKARIDAREQGDEPEGSRT